MASVANLPVKKNFCSVVSKDVYFVTNKNKYQQQLNNKPLQNGMPPLDNNNIYTGIFFSMKYVLYIFFFNTWENCWAVGIDGTYINVGIYSEKNIEFDWILGMLGNQLSEGHLNWTDIDRGE